jgi:hypothetical protein
MLRQADLPEKSRQAKKVIGIRDGGGESKGRR